VPQPLAGDPELVERFDIGPAEDRLVAPHMLVGTPDPRRTGVADAVRLHRADRRDAGAVGSDEVVVVVYPLAVPVRIELTDKQDPCVVAMRPPVGKQRL